jgi:hypothetical protein
LIGALLGLVVRSARSSDAGAIVFDGLHPHAASAFTRAGFFPIRKRSPRRFLWRTLPELAGLHPVLRDRSNWFVTRADSDWDHPDETEETET